MNSGTSRSSPGSPPRPRPPSGRVILAPGSARPGLVEPRGQAAVGQAHVADQALGVVVQRRRRARAGCGRGRSPRAATSRAATWASLTISRASERAFARTSLGLLFGAGAQLGEILATGGEHPLGLLARGRGEPVGLLLRLGQQLLGFATRLGRARQSGLRVAACDRARARPRPGRWSAPARIPRGRRRVTARPRRAPRSEASAAPA